MRAVGAICAGLVLLAACSNSTKTAAPAATTVPTMSVQQVASIVAEHRPALLDAIAKEDGCSSAIITAISDKAMKGVGPPDFPDLDPISNCEGAVNGFATDGAALTQGLSGINPPAEVAALVARTKTQTTQATTDAATLAGCLPESTDLLSPNLEARYAADDQIQSCNPFGLDDDVKSLKSTLSGWDAYL